MTPGHALRRYRSALTRLPLLRTALTLLGCCAGVVAVGGTVPAGTAASQAGVNPHPVLLHRPATVPLSAMAQLGKMLFFDPSMSASGRQSCASCHSPAHAYGPPDGRPFQRGGPGLARAGFRPPPSLMYLERQPNFSIGPDTGDNEAVVDLAKVAAVARQAPRAQKSAGAAIAAPAMVPQGGLFWDGRVDTLQAQASGPMFNPAEMANVSVEAVADKLKRPAYRDAFTKLFGPHVFNDSKLAVAEAMFALARFQVEDPSFHPYTSKYDYWLEGKATLSPAEARGLRLFNNPHGANCAGCHLSAPGRDGQPPLFTDHQYEALGVPRNAAIPANRNAGFFDMGLCGPFRTDLAAQTQYGGMFLTPTLRNAATRKVFFHNGVYHTLGDVMAFYNERDTAPAKIYPKAKNGAVVKFNDLPARYRKNVDRSDAPFNRESGGPRAMSDADIRDIIAFLKTLTDGYDPKGAYPTPPSDARSAKSAARG